MILPNPYDAHRKKLSSEDLEEIQDASNRGVPAKVLAKWHAMSEADLRLELERARQLAALRARFGGQANG